MKILLVEEFEENFDFSEELEYYADEVVDEDDQSKVQGAVYVVIDSDEILDFFWNKLEIDTDKNPELADELTWKKYVKEHYEELWEKFGDDIQNYYQDRAKDLVYDDWSQYAIEDDSPYDYEADLLRDYYRNVL